MKHVYLPLTRKGKNFTDIHSEVSLSNQKQSSINLTSFSSNLFDSLAGKIMLFLLLTLFIRIDGLAQTGKTKTNPIITWTTPVAITYGTALSATQLNARADVSGIFTYSPAPGTVLSGGIKTLSVTFTPNNTNKYNIVYKSTNITVNKASATLSLSNLNHVYDGAPKSATVNSSPVGLSGITVTYNGSTAVPSAAGSYSVVASLTNINYQASSVSGTLTITAPVKTTPVITWNTPAAITYGTALSATQLNATANVAGTFVYSPAAGSMLGGGNHQLSVSFTPTNTTLYNSASKIVSLTVNKATATLSLSNMNHVYDGSPKAATVTSSPAAITGISVTYNGSTTMPSAVGTYPVVASLTNTNYQASSVSGTLTITAPAKTTPIITWTTPGAITYGMALSTTQLNATANVDGTFVYSPATGTVLNAGTQALATSFTPTNTSLYNSASKTVSITVNKATATLSLSNLSHVYDGAPKAATVTSSPAGLSGITVTYNGSTAVPSAVGSYPVVATLNNLNYQASSVNGTLTIQAASKATPTITWNTPAAIIYGTALSTTQLNATANVAGTFTYTRSIGTVLNAGVHLTTATFTPTNTNDYNSATTSVNITVNKATATLSLSNLNHVYDGLPKAATVTSSPAGLSGITVAYNGSTTVPSAVGTYPVVASLNNVNYQASNATGTLTITAPAKTTPVITWNTPAAITYGTALSVNQLNATANVAGTFVYSPAAGSVLGGGVKTLTATFTPTNTSQYNTATASVNITVNKVNLLVKANDKSRLVGAANPVFTASYLGKKVGVVVLGSSTAAGTGASSTANSWVGLLTSRLTTDYPGLVTVTNLGIGGYTTYHILPTGTNNGSFRPAVDQTRNITAALALKPQLILINMPTNDVANGFSDTETMNNFATIINTAKAAGVKVLLTGTQPRNDAAVSSPVRLQTQNQELLKVYGADCINIYDELTDFATYGIKALYSYGDKVHLNNAGHSYIFSRMSGPVKTWIEANSSGFVNNDNAGSLSGTLAFSTTATSASPAGNYPIVPSGVTSANYNISFSNGVLTVTNGSVARPTESNEVFHPQGLYLSASPNPFSQRVNITLQSTTRGKTVIELFDIKGQLVKLVYQGDMAVDQPKNLVLLGQGLPKGVYFLRATQNAQVVHKRIMVD